MIADEKNGDVQSLECLLHILGEDIYKYLHPKDLVKLLRTNKDIYMFASQVMKDVWFTAKQVTNMSPGYRMRNVKKIKEYDGENFDQGFCDEILELKCKDLSPNVTDDHILKFSNLIGLYFWYCNNITDRSVSTLMHLAKLRSWEGTLTYITFQAIGINLTYLDCTGSESITDDCIWYCVKLTELIIDECNLTDECMKNLPWLVRFSCADCGGISGKYFRNLQNLVYLDCKRCELPAGVRFPQKLTRLNISGCYNLDDSSVGDQKELRMLDMSYNKNITNGCIGQLPLEELKCTDTNIGDNGIGGLTGLVRLDISGCEGITDDGLKPLPNLHFLVCRDVRIL